MLALQIILLVIVFLIGFIIFCPFSIELVYQDEVKLKVGYIFPIFKVLPQKRKSEKPEKPEKKKSEKEPKKKNSVLEFTKKQGLDGIIELLKEITGIILKLVDTIRRHLVMKTRLDLLVVGSDPADTAMKFGYACSAIYPLLSLIDRHTKLKRHEEYIDAGFEAEKTQVRFILKAHIIPVFVIIGAVGALIGGIRILRKIKQ